MENITSETAMTLDTIQAMAENPQQGQTNQGFGSGEGSSASCLSQSDGANTVTGNDPTALLPAPSFDSGPLDLSEDTGPATEENETSISQIVQQILVDNSSWLTEDPRTVARSRPQEGRHQFSQPASIPIKSGQSRIVLKKSESNHNPSIMSNKINPGSVLRRHTDPFARREGRTLIWKNVNMSVSTGNGKSSRRLLRDCWGECPKSQTTAIMGASGAGKTSLLNILAGRVRTSKRQRLIVEADVRLNNYPVDPTNIQVRQHLAFVAQDDSLLATATPRECIRFSAKLRLPESTSDEQLEHMTTRMLSELGLESCADSIIGGPLLKGVSGGERKRTSVGIELVTKPGIVFLDEPTSGLDAFSALQCCKVLQKVAKSGASVLFTIHQPSSDIFKNLDHLILMNKGRVMYHGPVPAVSKWFAERGHPPPPNYNPADWVIDVAQGYPIEKLENAGYFPKDTRQVAEPSQPDASKDAIGRSVTKSKEESLPGVATQVTLLFQREITGLYRDWTVPFVRVLLVFVVSLFIGMIFFDVGLADKADRLQIQSIFGAMAIVLVFGLLASIQIVLLAFPEERPVFLREYSTNHYSVTSYVVAKFTTEVLVTAIQTAILVVTIYYMVDFSGDILMFFLASYALSMTTSAQAILGAALAGDNIKLAQQLLPLFFTPQMLFAGFFVAPEFIPWWLRWAQNVCSMTYATRLMIVAEFENCSEKVSELLNCNEMLETTGSNPEDVWLYWLLLGVLFLVCRFFAFLVLQRSASTFY